MADDHGEHRNFTIAMLVLMGLLLVAGAVAWWFLDHVEEELKRRPPAPPRAGSPAPAPTPR